MSALSQLAYEVTIEDAEQPENSKTILLTRKVAFVGKAFVESGMRGITRKDFAGFHIAHYVQMLREAGLSIHTAMEGNTAAWGGKHARYTLLDKVISFKKVSIPKKKKPTSAATERASNPNTSNDQLGGIIDNG